MNTKSTEDTKNTEMPPNWHGNQVRSVDFVEPLIP